MGRLVEVMTLFGRKNLFIRVKKRIFAESFSIYREKAMIMKRVLTSYSVAMMLIFALVGCAVGAEDIVVPDEEPTALSFDAYVGRTSRDVATPDDINSVTALAQVGGFGVFGYAQDQRTFDFHSLEYTTPTFLVNQQIWNTSQEGQTGHKGADAAATEVWTYEPVKYFDNNPGALHSFFAYAPYDPHVKVRYAKGMPPQIEYSNDQDIDLLWSEPAKDQPKLAVGKNITFNFSHALAKTTFHVAPFVDMVHGTDSHPFPDTNIIPDGTTIRVRSIHLNGDVSTSGLMNTATGKWTTVQKGHYYNIPGAKGIKWVGNGKTPTTSYSHVEPSNKFIPARDVTIEVTYDVITGEDDDKSHITNRAESTQTFALEQGKAYQFYLDLGLTSVKFTAQVVDWSVKEEPEIQLQWIEPVTCIQLPWTDVDGGGINIGL